MTEDQEPDIGEGNDGTNDLGVESQDVETKPDDAHAVAVDLMKQLITLASGVLALSATFLEKFKPLSTLQMVAVALSWLLLLLSAFFGLETISAVVKSRLESDVNWSRGYGLRCAKATKYLFVSGIACFAFFALSGKTFVSEPAAVPKVEITQLDPIAGFSSGSDVVPRGRLAPLIKAAGDMKKGDALLLFGSADCTPTETTGRWKSNEDLAMKRAEQVKKELGTVDLVGSGEIIITPRALSQHARCTGAPDARAVHPVWIHLKSTSPSAKP
jgi:hypothetical protein